MHVTAAPSAAWIRWNSDNESSLASARTTDPSLNPAKSASSHQARVVTQASSDSLCARKTSTLSSSSMEKRTTCPLFAPHARTRAHRSDHAHDMKCSKSALFRGASSYASILCRSPGFLRFDDGTEPSSSSLLRKSCRMLLRASTRSVPTNPCSSNVSSHNVMSLGCMCSRRPYSRSSCRLRMNSSTARRLRLFVSSFGCGFAASVVIADAFESSPIGFVFSAGVISVSTSTTCGSSIGNSTSSFVHGTHPLWMPRHTFRRRHAAKATDRSAPD